jgi:UDP-N-acetylglucosamine 1-carboxyvinyltransferase
LVSSLLAEGSNTYSNVPDLKDVESIKLLLSNLGARAEAHGDTVHVDTGRILSYEAPYDLVRKMRASILVLGPMLARLQKASVSLPGGCAIGARPINLHLKGLAQLGADIQLEHGYVRAEAKKLKGADIYFDTVTVTGTENLMMAAVLAEGTTILRGRYSRGRNGGYYHKGRNVVKAGIREHHSGSNRNRYIYDCGGPDSRRRHPGGLRAGSCGSLC